MTELEKPRFAFCCKIFIPYSGFSKNDNTDLKEIGHMQFQIVWFLSYVDFKKTECVWILLEFFRVSWWIQSEE